MSMNKQDKRIEAELDYKNVAKNPIRAFPAVFVYFFSAALILGIYFVNKLDAISFNNVPGTSLDTLNVVHDVELKKGGIKPAIDLTVLLSPSKELLANGKKIFESTCASCHGIEGKGDGAASELLNPKPRNFHSSDGWTNGRTFYDMYKTVNNGVAGTGMTAFEYLPASDRIAAILYLSTFADFPKITSKTISKLDMEFQLSEETVEPNQIPIESAINKLIKENNVITSKALKLLDTKKIAQIEGYKLLEQYSFNLKSTIPIFVTNFSKVKTIDDFISSLSNSPEKYGMKDSIIELDLSQWELLYGFVKKLSSIVLSG